MDHIPRVPDSLETEEFIAVLIEEGKECGIRERLDARSTYEAAAAIGEEKVERLNRPSWRSEKPLSYIVLRRELGFWEPVKPPSD